MKNFFKIVLKAFLILLYIIDIFTMILSFWLLILWIKAKIEHNGLVLMGLIGMVHWNAIISLIVSILVFVIITVIFIKNKKRNK